MKKLSQYLKKTGLDKVASPWLPPLEEKIFASDLQNTDFREYWNSEKENENVLIGYQRYSRKTRTITTIFCMKIIGHILLVSSPGL